MRKGMSRYYRFVTQGRLPDQITNNIQTLEIIGGKVNFTYLAKNEEGKWRQYTGSIILSRPLGIKDYSLRYMRELTQGRVNDEVLKHITNVSIVKNRLVFAANYEGRHYNGAIQLVEI